MRSPSKLSLLDVVFAEAMFSLNSRAVLVTGASRGIGRAIALELGRAGADVIVHYSSNRAAAENVADSLRSVGSKSQLLSCDIRDRGETHRMVQKAGAWRGRLDGVVTSAGVYRGDSSVEIGGDEWDDMIRTDLEGTFRTFQAAIPFLRRSKNASVVTISSVLGSHAGAGALAYQAAKAGVEHVTRALAVEFAPSIRVNCVAPGFIRTDLNRGGHTDPTYSEQVRKATPLGRWGEPEDIAPAVRYLLSSEADWVTGAVLGIDGGIALR